MKRGESWTQMKYGRRSFRQGWPRKWNWREMATRRQKNPRRRRRKRRKKRRRRRSSRSSPRHKNLAKGKEEMEARPRAVMTKRSQKTSRRPRRGPQDHLQTQWRRQGKDQTGPGTMTRVTAGGIETTSAHAIGTGTVVVTGGTDRDHGTEGTEIGLGLGTGRGHGQGTGVDMAEIDLPVGTMIVADRIPGQQAQRLGTTSQTSVD
mmetsp:Transcript_15589/g.24238  ORF Transcript_15589/g.24238 Transcript_15589/m.24238 type:complete len:205 (-) Transcript_15589:53-667(-)